MTTLQAAWFYLQLVLLFALLGWLVYGHRQFLRDLGRFLVYYPGQGLILGLLYLLVFGQLGTTLGIPYLFWHEWPIHRASSSFGATLVLGLIGINAYYLIPMRLMDSVSARVDEAARKHVLRLPFGSWLEPPARTNAARLGRYLRVARTPFLLTLALPALLPGLFVNVPRTAPVFGPPPTFARGLVLPPENRGVDGDIRAYVLGLGIWAAGIVAGVLVMKGFIRVAQRVNPLVLQFLDNRLARREAMRRSRAREVVQGAPAAVSPLDAGPTRGLLAVDPVMVRSIRVFLIFFVFAYIIMCFVGDVWLPMSPGMAICTMLALGSMSLVALSFLRLRGRLAVVAGLAAWVALANNGVFKLRFENLDYTRRVAVDKALLAVDTAPPPAPGLATSLDVLEAWKPYARRHSVTPRMLPKLAVVCVTGGAARSAYWSAVVLDRLGQVVAVRGRGEHAQPTFDRHVRLITGASGGIMGAAHYEAHLYDRHRRAVPPDGMPADWVHAVPTNSLEAVARSLALRSPWALLLPRLGGGIDDRGIALEKDWPHLRRVSFGDLRAAEHRGQIPSLVVSPMTVEDGRRLLISNLDLRRVARRLAPRQTESLGFNRGGELSVEDPDGHGNGAYSRSAFELFKVFPGAVGLRLATAARMSATFPFVSPAVYLPTDPPLRVVDAGYYDGYGVDLAVAWIAEHRDWLVANTSGVVLVQIRDALSRRDRLSFPSPDASLYGFALRGYQFFFSPLDAILSARTSTAMFRNDQAVENLGIEFRMSRAGPGFFTTVVFENSANVATAAGQADRWPVHDGAEGRAGGTTADVEMSWYLTSAERRALETAIPSQDAARRHLDGEGVRDGLESDASLAHLRADLLRLKALAETPDQGPDGRYIERLYEQAANYYKMSLLDRWWRADHYPDRPRP